MPLLTKTQRPPESDPVPERFYRLDEPRITSDHGRFGCDVDDQDGLAQVLMYLFATRDVDGEAPF